MKDVVINRTRVTALMLTPMVWAMSRPINKRFMVLESQKMSRKHGSSSTASIPVCSMVPRERSPISQKMML